MQRRLMWVEFEDDARLSQSRQRPGDYSPLTRDSDDKLGHVTLSDVDEDDFESSSGCPSAPDLCDEWDAEEFTSLTAPAPHDRTGV